MITFKFGTYYEVSYGGEKIRDLFRLVVEVFQQPVAVVWYLVALVVLFFSLVARLGFGIKIPGHYRIPGDAIMGGPIKLDICSCYCGGLYSPAGVCVFLLFWRGIGKTDGGNCLKMGFFGDFIVFLCNLGLVLVREVRYYYAYVW